MAKGAGFKGGILLLTGFAAVAGLLYYASAVHSHHHHDTGSLQLAQACHGHGADAGHDHGEAGSLEQIKAACPLIKGSDKDAKCPVKALIGNKVVCPVMGNRTFTVTEDTIAVAHGGKVYFMCCPPCEGRFRADPEAYTKHQEKREGHEGHRHSH